MNDDQTITVDCLEAYIIQQLNMNWHGQDCTRAHELGLDVSIKLLLLLDKTINNVNISGRGFLSVVWLTQ